MEFYKESQELIGKVREKDKRIVKIYGLSDPLTDKIFYIGQSQNVKKRLYNHESDRSVNQGRIQIIDAIKSRGDEVKTVILEETYSDRAQEIEDKWINIGKKDGWPLTNQMDTDK